MRIILRRKGFDSSVGGYANPVLPGGELLSLPIPSSLDTIRYADLQAPGDQTIQTIIDELRIGRNLHGRGAHADPDLVKGMRPRLQGWVPSLGQIGAAASHLRNQNVDSGDLFLFYGYFRHTKVCNERLVYRHDSPRIHVIYGYLEVEEVIQATNKATLPSWLADHPHALDTRLSKPTNTIYLARDKSTKIPSIPGAGVFRFSEELVLTKSGLSRSRWALDPEIFRQLTITYHGDSAWRDGYFQSYRRAQEYVIHADKKAIDWAYRLIAGAKRWSLQPPSLPDTCQLTTNDSFHTSN